MSYLLIGLEGLELTAAEREWLQWPEIGGVVLFTRNFSDLAQLRALIGAVRERDPDALVCVDQEGGPVQRFGAPCTVLPPLGAIGRVHDRSPRDAAELAFAHGALMAAEMLALGVDLSFAPVLDLERGCAVIGARAFHREPEVVAALGRRYIAGMRHSGMAACGKHFPGHGSVVEDTHHEIARDERDWERIEREDLVPFAAAIAAGLPALMMGHVCYPRVCLEPAGYSPVWVREVLKRGLEFSGVVISDDLGMRAADTGSLTDRLRSALAAGCDLALVCYPHDVRAALERKSALPAAPANPARARLRGRRRRGWDELARSSEVRRWRAALGPLGKA